MSYYTLIKALELAKKCEFYTIIGGKSMSVIERAEELLGFPFSEQYRTFLKSVGYLSFSGVEIYGICKDDFSGTYVGCSVEAALSDRKNYNLPFKWLPICFFDDGAMGYLDYNQLNRSAEPPVIKAMYTGNHYEILEKIAEDFGDFLLELVAEQV